MDVIKNDPIWNLIQHNTLDTIIDTISSKDPINFDNFITNVLSLIGEEYKKTQRNLLIAILLMHKFPDELLSTIRDDEENNLYEKANEIYNKLIMDNIDYEKIGKSIYTFSIMYSEWKIKDKKMQLDMLSELYYRYTEDIQNFMKISNDMHKQRLYNNIFKKFLNKVLKHMILLEKNWQEYLSNYNYKKIMFDKNAHTFMYKKLTEVYWENLKLQYMSGYPIDIIHNVISDYIILLNKIDNRSNLEDLYNYKSSPSELCLQLIKLNKEMDDPYIYTDYIKKNMTFEIFENIFSYLERVLSDK